MSLFSISNLLLSTACFLLAFLIFYFSRQKLHTYWAMFNVAVGIYGLGMFLAGMSKNYNLAFFWWKIALFGVANIGLFFYLVVYEFCKLNDKKTLYFAITHGILFSILTLATSWIVNSLRFVFNQFYYTVAGMGWNIFFSIWVLITTKAFIDLHKFIRSSRGLQALQGKYLFYGMLLGFSTGATASIPSWGIDLYPVWHFFICVYAIICTYAIFKHQLMDIEVVIRRTVVFAGLFAFIYGIFSFAIILGQEIFQRHLNWNQWLAMIPTILVITLTLRPLENFLTNATERFLFQKKYDYRELLRTFTNQILTILDLQELMNQTVAELSRIIKLESAGVLLFDKDAKIFKLAASVGIKEKEIVFKETDALITYLKAANQHILKDKDADRMDGHSDLRDNFKKLNASLCLPIELHNDLLGVLCVGMKKSGEDYTPEDIDILSTLARTEAIAISNAKLFDELSKTQAEAAQREKMAVIGTLAAGINHEICNPLGIVRGHCEMFLLNYRDGLYKNTSQQEIEKIAIEIMNKVIKETDRATAITKRLSSFSKPSKRTEFENVEVEKEIDEVIALVEHDLKLSNIDIQKDFPERFPGFLADKKQIQEVLFNIIRNAAQAMDKKEGRIHLSGFAENGAAVIKISDNGCGIPGNKLEQVFHPFYTTKAPGKGTGLGLFIVKQVVERNKGTIGVESQEGIGTTFTLKFPVGEPLAAHN